MTNKNPIGFTSSQDVWKLLCDISMTAWEASQDAWERHSENPNDDTMAAYKAARTLSKALDAKKETFLQEWTDTTELNKPGLSKWFPMPDFPSVS